MIINKFTYEKFNIMLSIKYNPRKADTDFPRIISFSNVMVKTESDLFNTYTGEKFIKRNIINFF